LIPEFVEVYRNKPFQNNTCGCSVNHCFTSFAVAKLSPGNAIVENGVNAGMSGYLFRSAKPDATVWHLDPLSKPICDPIARTRWKDRGPGQSKYYVGPSDSPYYQEMSSVFAKSDGTDALEVAKQFGSHGFRDFFELEWSGIELKDMLVLFDTHQRDYDNVLKAVGVGFNLFLLDDNYCHIDNGDMQGHSVKQVFHRNTGQARNLASVLDFYHESPPLIQLSELPDHIKLKYPQLEVKTMSTPFKMDGHQYSLGLDPKPLLDLTQPKDLKLFELLLTVVSVEEFAWYNHMAVLGTY